MGIASFTETPAPGKYGKNWVICSQRVGHARTARKQHILVLWDRCPITRRQHVESFIASFRTKASRLGCRLYAIRGTNSIRNPSVLQRSSSRYKVGKLSVGEMININAHASKVHAMRLLNVKDPDAPGYCSFQPCA